MLTLPEPDIVTITVADYIDQAKNTKQPDIAFINSVAQVGLVYPLVFTDSGNGLVLRDGKRRLQALHILERTTCKAQVYKVDANASPELLTGITNMKRSRNEIAEFVAVEEMLAKGKTKNQITKALFITKAEIDKLMKLGNLSKPLWNALTQSQMKISTAYKAATLTKEKQQRLEGLLFAQGKITANDISIVKNAVRKEATESLPSRMFEVPSIEIGIEIESLDWRGACEQLCNMVGQMADAHIFANEMTKTYPFAADLITQSALLQEKTTS